MESPREEAAAAADAAADDGPSAAEQEAQARAAIIMKQYEDRIKREEEAKAEAAGVHRSNVVKSKLKQRPVVKLKKTETAPPQERVMAELRQAVKLCDQLPGTPAELKAHIRQTLKMALGFWGEAESFWKAAKRGDLGTLERLEGLGGMDVNAHWGKQGTALHAACGTGMVSCVAFLLDKGARAMEADRFGGDTPLHEALSVDDEKHVECLRLLLNSGRTPQERVDPNVTNKSQKVAPLHIAVSEGMVEQARMLLAKDALPRIRNKDGDTPADAGETALELLPQPTALSSAYDRKLYADDKARIEQCIGLVDAAAEATAERFWRRAYAGDAKGLRDMINARRDPDAHWGNKGTPLHAACGQGHAECVALLLDEGKALPAPPDAFAGDTPMHETMAGDDDEHLASLKLLLRFGAPPSQANRQGQTPLHTAAAEGMVRQVRALIVYGANVAARDLEGLTPAAAAERYRSGLVAPGAAASVKDREIFQEDVMKINEYIALLRAAPSWQNEGGGGGGGGGRRGVGGDDGEDEDGEEEEEQQQQGGGDGGGGDRPESARSWSSSGSSLSLTKGRAGHAGAGGRQGEGSRSGNSIGGGGGGGSNGSSQLVPLTGPAPSAAAAAGLTVRGGTLLPPV